MSLVITSSSQQEYDKTSKTYGIENPASYQNFLKSPLIIEPDSEVALVSLKCNRDDDTIDISRGDGFWIYWGFEGAENSDFNGDEPHKSDDINTPIRIQLVEDTYTRQSFVNHLQERLDDVLKKAHKEIDTITVSENIDSNNVFKGFKIQLVQKGDGSGLTDKPSAAEFEPYIDANTVVSYSDDSKYDDDDEKTDNFVASASGTDVLITGYKAGSTGAICDVIGKAHPLSQVNSQCVIYFNGSSAAGVTDGYTLGLVRSMGGSDEDGDEIDFGAPGGVSPDLNISNYDDSVNVPELYEPEDASPSPPFFWDVAFNWVPGKDGQVIHYINNNEDGDTEGIMKAVTLQNTPTNASLQAKYWDRVIFEVTGEKIDVKLGRTGSGSTTTLVSSASDTFGQRVKPIGQTCNQLYPKIAIHNNDTTNPGTAWLNTWNGHSQVGYYENNFWGYYDVGEEDEDEPYPFWADLYKLIDRSSIYGDGTILTLDANDDEQDYVYKGELTSNKGIANKYVIITSSYAPSVIQGGSPSWFWTVDQINSLTTTDKVQNVLGFDVFMDQTEYGTIADDGADITFTSVRDSSFTPQSSMFLRLKNMAINSYNANKSSISNIIYACPKFDAQGNTGGLLYYEPGERVYVKLNNPSKMVLNSLDIDLVNVNEQVLEDLIGNTLAVLHFRKSK